jgi:hypothetical protein
MNVNGKGRDFVRMTGAQGTDAEANTSRRRRWFAWARATARLRAAFTQSSAARVDDVDERMQRIKTELEEARRLDGSAPRRTGEER